MKRATLDKDVAEALQDSAYLAGAKAGWNAAQADNPNAAYERLVSSRAGHLKPLKDAKAGEADE